MVNVATDKAVLLHLMGGSPPLSLTLHFALSAAQVDVSQEKLVCSIMLGLEKPLPQRPAGSNSTASSSGFGFLPASLGQLITSAAGIRSLKRGEINQTSSNSDSTVLLDPASVSGVGSIRTALGSQDEWSELDQAAAAALAAATASTWVGHTVKLHR